MADSNRSEASNLAATEHSTRAVLLLSLAGATPKMKIPDPFSSDVRMDRVSRLRVAITQGNYFVSTGDLAQKLLDDMADGPSLRFRGDSGTSRSPHQPGGVSTHRVPRATFPRRQASESAEEINDERVGKADRN